MNTANYSYFSCFLSLGEQLRCFFLFYFFFLHRRFFLISYEKKLSKKMGVCSVRISSCACNHVGNLHRDRSSTYLYFMSSKKKKKKKQLETCCIPRRLAIRVRVPFFFFFFFSVVAKCVSMGIKQFPTFFFFFFVNVDFKKYYFYSYEL